jgi:hypothetical protein
MSYELRGHDWSTLEDGVRDGHCLLAHTSENPCGRWTKVTEIDAVDLSTVHGHIFVLTSDGFIAYEYQDGPTPNLSSIRKGFFVGFIDYLVINGLTNLLGL